MRKNPGRIIGNAAVFILLETVSLLMLSHSNSVMRSRLGIASSSIQAFFGRQAVGIRDYFSLRSENERLSRETFRMMEYILDSGTGNGGNCHIASFGDYDCIDARIIRSSAGKQHNTFIIDKGALDGIDINDGVITTRGAVGIVEMTADHFSRVISFTNYDMAVSTRLRHDGPAILMVWDGISQREGRIENIPIHIPVSPGDTVYTSGFSSIFPPDIPLGLVSGKAVMKGSYSTAAVRLFEDFSRIRNVIVIKNRDKDAIEELLP